MSLFKDTFSIWDAWLSMDNFKSTRGMSLYCAMPKLRQTKHNQDRAYDFEMFPDDPLAISSSYPVRSTNALRKKDQTTSHFTTSIKPISKTLYIRFLHNPYWLYQKQIFLIPWIVNPVILELAGSYFKPIRMENENLCFDPDPYCLQKKNTPDRNGNASPAYGN